VVSLLDTLLLCIIGAVLLIALCASACYLMERCSAVYARHSRSPRIEFPRPTDIAAFFFKLLTFL
jgi:hypothetical protein